MLASGFSSGVSPVGWVLVLPDQTAPNYPPKRRDGVLAVEGHMMIIFGGYSAITGGYLNDVRTAAGGNARARARAQRKRVRQRPGIARTSLAALRGVLRGRMMLRTILILHQ